MSPSMLDNTLEYSAQYISQFNSVFAPYNFNHFSSLQSRGVHPISSVSVSHDGGTTFSSDPATFVFLQNNAACSYVIRFSADFVEPLLISPFIFSSSKYQKEGLTNVNHLTFNFTIDNTFKNVWSAFPNPTLGAGSSYSISLGATPFSNFSVYINALTPHVTDLIPPVTILPCVNYERFISSANNLPTPIAARVENGNLYEDTVSKADIYLNNLVLSQIPEMLYIVVRKVNSQTSFIDAKGFLAINSCSISFMNAQGMLANATQDLLWKISKENGICLDWLSWSGVANNCTSVAGPPAVSTFKKQYLIGSILAINPAKDLSLNTPFITNGSNGNYNLQIKLNVSNYYLQAVQPEIMIVIKNSCYLKNYPGGKSTLNLGYFTGRFIQFSHERR